METLIISAVNFYDCSNFNRKKGALVLTTLPRSSIRRTIFIPNFCADAHFWGMALNLSPSFTLQMMEIILVIAFSKKHSAAPLFSLMVIYNYVETLQ